MAVSANKLELLQIADAVARENRSSRGCHRSPGLPTSKVADPSVHEIPPATTGTTADLNQDWKEECWAAESCSRL